MKEHLVVYDGLLALSMGSTHLVEMRQAGELYVDKTGQIQQLLDESARQVFIARPSAPSFWQILDAVNHRVHVPRPHAGCPDSPGNLLRWMIGALKDRFGKEPVVLIDEFDAPLTMFG